MIIKILIIGIWILCGVIHYGVNLAYYQRKWPSIAKGTYESDVVISFILSLFGPIALLSMIIVKDYGYGIKFANRDNGE